MKQLLKNYLLLSKKLLIIKAGKLFALVVCFVTRVPIEAQVANYVNNGGFEAALSNTTSNFNAAEFWGPIDTSKASYVLLQTVVATGGTGYQLPRHGNNFILSQFFCNSCEREYPRNRLKQVLKPNTAYCAKYFVVNTNNNRVAIDKYGMYFGNSTIDTITKCMSPLVYLNPQVENTSGIITDTLNWTPITGTFVANGDEKYLLLGNFRSNPTTNTLLINTPLQVMSNDIYIDDVSLIELELPASAGTDTFVIPGDSVFLGREPDIGIDEACMWYKLPNATTAIDTVAGLWVKPVVTTTYVVRQEICGNVKWDTVVVYQSALGIQTSKFQVQSTAIYPVPANDVLNVNLEMLNDLTDESFELLIYNSLGQIVREEEIVFKNRNALIKTDDLMNGVYLLQIKNGETQTVSRRFVISRH